MAWVTVVKVVVMRFLLFAAVTPPFLPGALHGGEGAGVTLPAGRHPAILALEYGSYKDRNVLE